MIDRRVFVLGFCATAAGAACAKPTQSAAIRVYKTPTCGCCGAWVQHLRDNNFSVEVEDMDDVTPVARKLGVPDELRSCHTAEVAGYFVEGHVPASDVRKLIAERPVALGIAVPGMPIGSPGMEQAGKAEDFVTLLVRRGGKSDAFVSHIAGS